MGVLCIVVGTAALIPLTRWFLKGKSTEGNKHASKTLEQLAEEYKLAEELTRLQVTEDSKVMASQSLRYAAPLRATTH